MGLGLLRLERDRDFWRRVAPPWRAVVVWIYYFRRGDREWSRGGKDATVGCEEWMQGMDVRNGKEYFQGPITAHYATIHHGY